MTDCLAARCARLRSVGVLLVVLVIASLLWAPASAFAGTGFIYGTVQSAIAGVSASTSTVSAYSKDAAGDWVPAGSAETTANGAFRIDGLATGSPYRVEIRPHHEDEFLGGWNRYGNATATSADLASNVWVYADKGTRLDPVVIGTAGLMGSVIDEGGFAIPYVDVVVQVLLESGEWSNGRNFSASSSGGFVAAGLPPGRTFRLTVHDDSLRYHTLVVPETYAPGPRETLAVAPIVLHRYATASGRLVSEDGSLVSGVLAHLYRIDDATGALVEVRETTVYVDGYFSFIGVEPGEHTVFFEVPPGSWLTVMPGYLGGASDAAGATSFSVIDDESVVLGETRLPVGGEITGTLRAAWTGELVSPGHYKLYRFDEQGDTWSEYWRSATSYATGQYRFVRLPAGTYRVFSDPLFEYKPAYYPNAETFDEAQDIEVTFGEVTTADMTMYRPERISIAYTSALSGRDLTWMVPEVWVAGQEGSWVATDAAGLALPWGYHEFENSLRVPIRVTVTDPKGWFMPVGYPSGTDVSSAEDITIARGQHASIEVMMQPRVGAITGSIVDARTGLPIPFATVGLSILRGDISRPVPPPFRTVQADAGGVYVITGVEPDEYVLTITDPADEYVPWVYGRPWWERVTVGPTELRSVDASLVVRGSIAGTVTVESDGAPVSGIVVRATDRYGATVATATTDSLGAYRIGRLVPSWYDVAFENIPTDLYDADGQPLDTTYVWPESTATVSEQLTRRRVSRIVLAKPPTAVSYNGSVRLAASLQDGSGAPLNGPQRLPLWKSPDGKNWTLATEVAGDAAAGRYSTTVSVLRKTWFRYSWPGTASTMPATSAAYSVTPKAYVGFPNAPGSAKPGAAFTVWGYLRPKHTAGTGAVRIYKYRRVRGAWRSYGYVTAKIADYNPYSSKYSRGVVLPSRGEWRIRAYHKDGDHLATVSGYNYLWVK